MSEYINYMQLQKLISIVTLVHNHEKYISHCIESVIEQLYSAWELIIIDDGSTDRTSEIVAGYNDSRIKYHWQQNKGLGRLSETYNKALTLADGEFIAILEGDDWWPANKLSLQVGDFIDENVVLSFGYTQEVDENGKPIKLIPEQNLPVEALDNVPVGRASRYLMDMKILTYLFPVSVIIRKSALLRVGGFQQLPYLPLIDYPTFMQLSRLGKFSFHQEILGYWRRHSESTTRKKYYLINEGVYCYLTSFQQMFADSLPIAKNELAFINREWQEFKWHQWFTLGRWCLVDGEWRRARQAFVRCRPYAFNWKHPALLTYCILSAYFHLNIEWLIDCLQLMPLSSSLDSFNHDNITLSKDMLEEL